jgi:hypothetical protein
MDVVLVGLVLSVVGIAVVVSFAVSQSHMVVDILTPDSQPARIESTK